VKNSTDNRARSCPILSERLRAIVIQVSEAQKEGKASDIREILQIAQKLAKIREKTESDIPILELFFLPKSKAYVAVYPHAQCVDRITPHERLRHRGVHRKNE